VPSRHKDYESIVALAKVQRPHQLNRSSNVEIPRCCLLDGLERAKEERRGGGARILTAGAGGALVGALAVDPQPF
jgi:hypothetical protein